LLVERKAILSQARSDLLDVNTALKTVFTMLILEAIGQIFLSLGKLRAKL